MPNLRCKQLVELKAKTAFLVLVFICSKVFLLFTAFCEHPWTEYNNRCYRQDGLTVDYYRASSMCDSHGATLVSISSEKEHEFLVDK